MAARARAEQDGSDEHARSGPNGATPASSQRETLHGISLVRMLREHAGLSRGELADKMGCSRQNVWRLEQRGLHVEVATVMAIGRACGVAVRWAFGPVRKDCDAT